MSKSNASFLIAESERWKAASVEALSTLGLVSAGGWVELADGILSPELILVLSHWFLGTWLLLRGGRGGIY